MCTYVTKFINKRELVLFKNNIGLPQQEEKSMPNTRPPPTPKLPAPLFIYDA